MAKKVILFLSVFLLFFCFTFAKAEEVENTSATSTLELIPVLYEEFSTSTDMLITPSPESIEVEQKDTIAIKNEEFLEKCSLLRCRVPIPTLKDPDNSIFSVNQKIYLTGLTWNDTIIDVYLNDDYVGQAIVVNDEDSNTANFHLELESDLDSGKYSWSVIARSLNERDRSFVSKENSFTIESSITEKQIIKTEDEALTEESTSSISEEDKEINVISSEIDASVSVLGEQIEADVSVISSEADSMLVVEQMKSDSEIQSQDTEILQGATVSEEQIQEIYGDLDAEEVITETPQEGNKKLGILLLGGLILIIMFRIFFRKKK